jgi:hypothetical protein
MKQYDQQTIKEQGLYYIKEKVKKRVERLFAGYTQYDFRENFYYEGLAQAKVYVPNKPYTGFNSAGDYTQYVFSIWRMYYGDDIKTGFQIHAKPEMIEAGDDAHTQFKYVFQMFLDKCVKYHNINIPFESYPYVAVPTPEGTGGWDGGDPMGRYSMTYEVMEEECKMGHLYVIDNKVVLDLKKLGESFSLLKDMKEKVTKWTK